MYHDCRTDKDYNQKFLTDQDKIYLKGFDWAVETAFDTAFDNLDTILDNDYIMHLMEEELPDRLKDEYEWESDFGFNNGTREVKTYGDYIRMRILEFIESQRNELIIGILDEMSDDTYNEMREKNS